ncbi:hypothetical protein AVEN_150849-1, partial [Araneus ventricosus]
MKKGKGFLKKAGGLRNMMLKPAYPCDEWSQEKRICFLNRNVGNTVTFVLATPPPHTAGRIRVEWHQEFATLDPKKKRTYHINPKDPPWNMVIGSGGHELRVSPITEIDIYSNYFTAIVHYQYGTPNRKLHFVIRAIFIDVGLVYPGATMTLHVPSFVSLPSEGMTFNWTLNGGPGSILPSNMRPSPSGASLRISELRKEQEGIVACSVYTNLGFHAIHLDFSIRKVESDNNQLIFIPTRPPHKLIPLDKRKRSGIASQQEAKRKTSGRRELSVSSNVLDQQESQFLKKPSSKYPHYKKLLIGHNYLSRNRKKRSPQLDYSSDYLKDSADNKQAVIKVTTDFHLQEHQPPLTPRYLNKRQDNEAPTSQEQDYDLPMDMELKIHDPNMKDEYIDEFESEDHEAGSQNQLNV